MEQQRCNTCAIIGFVLSFYTPIVGLVLSIIGLNQIKKNGESGKGLAIAGIIISIILMLLVVVWFAAIILVAAGF